MNTVLINSDRRPVVTMYYSYIHTTKVRVLVYLIHSVHLINERNVEHIRLIYVSSSFPYFVICRISRLC